MFYNVKNKSGWILSNLKNRRLTDKQTKNSKATGKDGSEDENDDYEGNGAESGDGVQANTYTEENAKDDCEFLRSVVVNASNRAKIEEKLIATADYRKKICMDPNNSLLKQFPFFFTHSEWVSNSFMLV